MNSNAGAGMFPRIHQALRLVGYNALTAVALLVLIELGLRLWNLELRLPPLQVEIRSPASVKLERHYRTDPDLLWVPHGYADRVAAARGSRPSIVFMGDSCTTGGYEEQMQSLVAERHPESDFTWATLGVVGWSSWSGLQQLRRDVLPIEPRAITIYYGWNDHWDHFGLQDKDAASFFHRENVSPLAASFANLRTTHLITKGLLAYRKRFVEPDPARVSLDDFRANLRLMIRIARDNDIIPILLTAPTSHQPGAEPAALRPNWLAQLEDLVPLHRRYVEAVRAVAAAESVVLVDLHRAFDELPREVLASLFIADGIHLTPAGDRKIAQLIDQRLDETGLYRLIM